MERPLFKADLSFLFDQPSSWVYMAEVLAVLIPILIGLSAIATWRVGERHGRSLLVWVLGYLVWFYWPIPLEPALVLPGRVVSVILWFWLVEAWKRRINWHEPVLLGTNLLIAIALAVGAFCFVIALATDTFKTQSPFQTDQEFITPTGN